jgi:hypothetical protein
MRIEELLMKVKNGERVAFQETMAVISANYDYTPTRFTNGVGPQRVTNDPGTNEGSCKLFYFARLHGLPEAETLALFGDYYWRDVLEHPESTDHANIRSFMKSGWAGIAYDGEALRLRPQGGGGV